MLLFFSSTQLRRVLIFRAIGVFPVFCEGRVMAHTAALSERAQHLLKVLIEQYIDGGHPVGSRALARDAGLDLSPATVRNVMADLEEMGLVASPHMSAGRVPTVTGYRLFVDSLITIQPLRYSVVQQLKKSLTAERDTRQLVEEASKLLSKVTELAGVVMVPRRDRVSFRHIEFLSLSNNRVLAILVTNEKEVQNRIVSTNRQYSAAELEQAANYLTALFVGKDLAEVRKELLQEMQEAKESMDQIMATALEIGNQALDVSQGDDDYVLAGETNLMQFHELADMERLRQLFETFNEKHEILRLLDQCINAARVNIFIGEESGYTALGDCSVVAAPYSVDGQIVGVLGVIGPTRMEYHKVIPIVDATAKLVGTALKSH